MDVKEKKGYMIIRLTLKSGNEKINPVITVPSIKDRSPAIING